MSSRLLAVPVVVAVLAGCVSTQNRETLGPQPAAPRTHIYASYTAGLGGQRTVRATFRTDQDAYVIVGHLGGDGHIRILYPANAYRSSQTIAGKSYQTRTGTARYDANPAFYRMTPAAFRSPGARVDSYDGQGNGFVFMIASRSPLLLDALPGAPFFDELELEDYFYAFDPRDGIRDFAESLAGGLPYTLDFASSLGTAASLTYAQNSAIGCDGFDRPGYGLMGAFDPFLSGWGLGSFAWYFQRPSMYFTNRFWARMGYPFGSEHYGIGSCYGPGYYAGGLWAENRWTGVFPTTPYVPGTIYPPPGPTGGPQKTGGMKLRGPRIESQPGNALALSRPSFAPRSGRIPTGSSTNGAAAPSGFAGRRDTESARPFRPATVSHAEPTRQAARPSGSYDAPRLAPTAPAPRASVPAASAPASPPPKVAASGAEKPREPDRPNKP